MGSKVGDRVYVYYDPDMITGTVLEIDERSTLVLWDGPEKIRLWCRECDLKVKTDGQ